MNQEQVLSVVRQLLLVTCGGLVTKGYVDEATLDMIVGGVMGVLAAGWALHARRNAGLVAAAAAVPEVRRIVAGQAVADAVSSRKVIASDDRVTAP